MADLQQARERLALYAKWLVSGDDGDDDITVDVRAADIRAVLSALDASEDHVERLTEELDINCAIEAAYRPAPPPVPATPRYNDRPTKIDERAIVEEEIAATPAPEQKWKPSEAELAELMRRSAEAKAHPETLIPLEVLRRAATVQPRVTVSDG